MRFEDLTAVIPKDGGSMSLRNVTIFLQDYTVLQPTGPASVRYRKSALFPCNPRDSLGIIESKHFSQI